MLRRHLVLIAALISMAAALIASPASGTTKLELVGKCSDLPGVVDIGNGEWASAGVERTSDGIVFNGSSGNDQMYWCADAVSSAGSQSP